MEIPKGIIGPDFISYQTHVVVNTTLKCDFEDQLVTIIHGTTAEGHLYEKRIAVNTFSYWERIDDTLETSAGEKIEKW